MFLYKMLIFHHLLLALLLCVVLFKFYSWKVLFVLFGGVLVDFDHYLLFILKYRTLNIKKSYLRFKETHRRGKREPPTKFELLFHSIEFFILIIILSFFSEIFLLVFIGLFFHLLTDGILKKWIYQIYKYKKIKSYSIIGWYIIKKKKKLKF